MVSHEELKQESSRKSLMGSDTHSKNKSPLLHRSVFFSIPNARLLLCISFSLARVLISLRTITTFGMGILGPTLKVLSGEYWLYFIANEASFIEYTG